MPKVIPFDTGAQKNPWKYEMLPVVCGLLFLVDRVVSRWWREVSGKMKFDRSFVRIVRSSSNSKERVLVRFSRDGVTGLLGKF